MEYIQISDIIFQVKNNTENSIKTSAMLLIDDKQTIINVYKTECSNIYLYKGIIQQRRHKGSGKSFRGQHACHAECSRRKAVRRAE